MNVTVTTAAEGFPRKAFTVDDISRMIEAGIFRDDEKFELVEGEIVMMCRARATQISAYDSCFPRVAG